jgi:uncharacterized protein YyaL (SSP411 family)
MPNRLLHELSPYLVQHAHNPVDWYPWGEEALARAKAENKPILLSIGYSACHWCHVMEDESFSDEETARLMNASFVSIKVDREERPDIDHIYQLVVQLMGRSGGWPLTVFLTPSQKPFFGGTYFPPVERYGMASFKTLLATIRDTWEKEHDDLVEQAEQITRAIARVTTSSGAAEITDESLARAASDILDRSDGTYGGFGMRPKFPNTMALDVLALSAKFRDDVHAKKHVALTLEKMRAGGVYDQLGGGFHRYSTDEKWLVPHFEKMLYDNALLLRAYADAFRAYGTPRFRDAAREIAAYLTSEMRDPSGAFYSTEDADSEGEEGKFFVWTEGEVRALLREDVPARDVALACFGITEKGNFEHSFTTVLSMARPLADVAKELKLDEADASAALERARRVLLDQRAKRVRPFRDEKILTSWNALAIGALAEAGVALDDAPMLEAATRAFDAVQATLVTSDNGRLRVARLMKGGRVKGIGFLDDYAYLADAALDLYEAAGAPEHAAFARALADEMLSRFHRDAEGAVSGFFFTEDASSSVGDSSPAGSALIVRPQDAFDSAVPSGTSVACRVLLRLGSLVDARFEKIAAKELARLAPQAFKAPLGLCHALVSMDRLVRGSVDVVLLGPRDDARTRALAKTVHNTFIPHRTVAWLDPADETSRDACARLADGKPAQKEPAAYVCKGRTCSLPITSPEELAKLLA